MTYLLVVYFGLVVGR